MKYFIFTLLIILFTKTALSADIMNHQLPNIEDDSTVIINYVDNFKQNSAISDDTVRILPKKMRLKSNGATILVKSEDLPEEVEKCISYACSIWEGIIESPVSFQIEIQWIDSNVDISTDVVYFKDGSVFYPRSLYDIQTPNPGETSIPSGVIKINKNTEWDYAVGGNINMTKKNLTYGLLRGICRIMGFGSSIKVNEDNTVCFTNMLGKSNFDYMIESSDGLNLADISSIPRDNKPLQEFLNHEGREFYLTNDKVKIQLAGKPYDSVNPPLSNLRGGLMKKDVSEGDFYLQIDDELWTALRWIGWNMDGLDDVRIESLEQNESALFDAYHPHKFHLIGASNSQNISWAFKLPTKDGYFHDIPIKKDGLTCEIPAINSSYDYELTIDGLIRGILECQYEVSGILVKVPSYNVYLEVLPAIQDVQILNFEYSPTGSSIRAEYEVRYSGGESILAYDEQEYGGISIVHLYNEPAIARGKTDWLSVVGYSWINFITSNDLGKAYYIIEIEPYTQNWYPLDDPADYFSISPQLKKIWHSDINHLEQVDALWEFCEIYDINGVLMHVSYEFEDIESINLKRGIYIIKYYDKLNNLITTKKSIK